MEAIAYRLRATGSLGEERTANLSHFVAKMAYLKKLIRPNFVEDVSETDEATVGVDALVAGGGIGIGDVLEGAFDIEGPVFVQKELQSAGELRGELHVCTNGILVRPVAGVGIDDAGSTLNIRHHNPVRLDEIITNEAGHADHVGPVAVPDVGAGGFQDGFEIATEGVIDTGLWAPGIRRIEHPAEADVVLLVVEDGDDGTDTAGGEHGAGHEFKSDAIFDKDMGGKIVRLD